MTDERKERIQEKARQMTREELTSYVLHLIGYSVNDISLLQNTTPQVVAENLISAGIVLGEDALRQEP